MNKESNKIYNRAIKNYQSGQYIKALELCEKGISRDLKNTALLNLKGLLFYLNGDLKEATAVWNINRDYNNDEISKVYLKDSKNDEEKLKLYIEAESNIKELNIDDAIRQLNICTSSDFNSINVNNALAICFIRKGQYDIAKQFNQKSLEIDMKNKNSLNIKNELITLTKSPKEEFNKKMISLITAVLALTITTVVIISVRLQANNNLANNNEIVEEPVEDNIIEKSNDTNMEEDSKQEETVILNDEQIKDIYIKGTDYFENKQYEKAIEILNKGVTNTSDNYLNEHILFLLASSYDNNKNIEKGIKYYEDYVNKYSAGSYIDEVYYKLAIIYKEQNSKENSKKYAKLLNDNYPKSIYINTIIKEIISS